MIIWFNINNYIPGEVYNFYSFYNENSKLGYKVNLVSDEIILTLNSATYSYNLTGSDTNDAVSLSEETWYCYVMNVDQRNGKSEHFIYKRDVDDEEDAPNLSNTILKQVYKTSFDITPIAFESEGWNPTIYASDMKVTNLRLFLDIIPENIHNKILNQYIIGDDSKYLVFADNATTRLYLPRFPLFE